MSFCEPGVERQSCLPKTAWPPTYAFSRFLVIASTNFLQYLFLSLNSARACPPLCMKYSTSLPYVHFTKAVIGRFRAPFNILFTASDRLVVICPYLRPSSSHAKLHFSFGIPSIHLSTSGLVSRNFSRFLSKYILLVV